MSRVRPDQGPPTLWQRPINLHVWSHWRHIYNIPSFIEILLAVSELHGIGISHFPLLWLLAFTTDSNTAQAVIISHRIVLCTKLCLRCCRYLNTGTNNTEACTVETCDFWSSKHWAWTRRCTSHDEIWQKTAYRYDNFVCQISPWFMNGCRYGSPKIHNLRLVDIVPILQRYGIA